MRLYKQPPTVEEMMRSFVEHLTKLFRVKITYSIYHKNGNYECVEIADPDSK